MTKQKKIFAIQGEAKTPDDVMQAVNRLKHLADTNQLFGLSFAAIKRHEYELDYHGWCIDNPEFTMGALQRLAIILSKQSERYF